MQDFNFKKTPIIDIVNNIIIDNVINKASDIHFDPAEEYLNIRARIDGDLRDYAHIDKLYEKNLITRLKLMSGMNITETRLPQDGAIKTKIEGQDLDLRVASIPTSYGEKIVIRILDYSMSLEGISSLGFTDYNLEKVNKMLDYPNGIILVTGATGSGKSTTVYSMLQKLNKETVNILTAEDPVEMNIKGINQIQVNAEIGLTFGNILRSILRHDPNIILIGEIRDTETAKIAVRASITGHLVLSTLHTNDSLSTIERMLDMGVERYLLSTSLSGIISQTLAKRLCPKCRVKRPTTEYEKNIFKKALNIDVDEIYTTPGCEECTSGYKGRIALQEVLLINDDIRFAINDNIDRQDLQELVYKKGTRTLLQDGLIKVLNGITTIEQVINLIDVEDDLEKIYSFPTPEELIINPESKNDEKITNETPIIKSEDKEQINVDQAEINLDEKVFHTEILSLNEINTINDKLLENESDGENSEEINEENINNENNEKHIEETDDFNGENYNDNYEPEVNNNYEDVSDENAETNDEENESDDTYSEDESTTEEDNDNNIDENNDYGENHDEEYEPEVNNNYEDVSDENTETNNDENESEDTYSEDESTTEEDNDNNIDENNDYEENHDEEYEPEVNNNYEDVSDENAETNDEDNESENTYSEDESTTEEDNDNNIDENNDYEENHNEEYETKPDNTYYEEEIYNNNTIDSDAEEAVKIEPEHEDIDTKDFIIDTSFSSESDNDENEDYY